MVKTAELPAEKYKQLEENVQAINQRIAQAKARGELHQQEAAKIVVELQTEFGIQPAQLRQLIAQKETELQSMEKTIAAKIAEAEETLKKLETV